MPPVRHGFANRPRIGWDLHAPVQPVPAPEGLESLHVQRDDLVPALFGGSKPRKLDFLLAAAPWRDQTTWTSLGGVGSGHLVALLAAAMERRVTLDAHVFWQTPSPGVLRNLAYLTQARLTYHPSRIHLITAPRVFLPSAIPPGATHPVGDLGLVEAAMEVEGDYDRVYVALGSGGTAAGLAVGFALAGKPTEVVAVAAVERWLLSVRREVRRLQDFLGTSVDVRLRVVHNQLGRGYGIATEAGRRAMAAAPVGLEEVYTAKAFAGLLAEARLGGRVLFWHTAGRPPPEPEAWSLPFELRPPSRRWFLAAAAVGVVAWRTTGYPAARGGILTDAEMAVLSAAAEAILPPAPGPFDAATVDRYVAALPRRYEVHALLQLVEQAGLVRFTRQSVEERLRTLDRLPPIVSRSVRDLVYLGYYQSPEAWRAIGYEGPPGIRGPAYEELRAPPGARPRAAA